MDETQEWFDGDSYGKSYDEELNLKFGMGGRARKPAVFARKILTRKPFVGEVISTAKIERKINKYLADEEEGRRRLAEAKIQCAASADLIAKALAPRRNTDPIERLKKFSIDLMKRDQREAKKTKNENLKNALRSYQIQNYADNQGKMEALPDPFDSSRGLKYTSRSAVGDVSFNRVCELKQLLEERKRYFNGELDDVYYKIGPDGNSMPSPPNIRIKSAHSIMSSRDDFHTISNLSESLDSISEQTEFHVVKQKSRNEDLEENGFSEDEFIGDQELTNKMRLKSIPTETLQDVISLSEKNKRSTLSNRWNTFNRHLNIMYEPLNSTSEPTLDNVSKIMNIGQDKAKSTTQILQQFAETDDNLVDAIEKAEEISTQDSKSESAMTENIDALHVGEQKNKIGTKRSTMRMPIRLATPGRGMKYSSKSSNKSKPKHDLVRKYGPFKKLSNI